ncbi:Uncharacterised protein [Mycobacterium tuberculosis]|nr:Uncharacterised protein [Mycobacterium tuberculosis]CKP40384.1 Uncharacterised protein [Mycobacterium tuberculosis]CNV33254.1 Uncharacterised protein [Mycobacterium tuberculosis]
MVQRCHLQLVAHIEVVDLCRSQQREVAHVGECTDVQHRVVGQRVTVAKPHLLLGSLARQKPQALPGHDAHVPLVELPEPGIIENLDRVQPRQAVGRRRRWHNVLVGNALLFGLERRRHAEYGFPVLDCVDPPGAERSTVADAFDQKNRALLGISRPKKIAVQRVHHVPRVDGAHRRHQRLAGYMTTESALQEARFGAEHASSVDVDLKLLKIKDLFDRHAMTVCSSRVLTSRAGRADDRQRSRPR